MNTPLVWRNVSQEWHSLIRSTPEQEVADKKLAQPTPTLVIDWSKTESDTTSVGNAGIPIPKDL